MTDMNPIRRGSLLREVLGHLAMGAGSGAFLAVSLIAGNARNIFGMIANSSTPELTMIVFFGIFTTVFGVGAALTGTIFTLMEKSATSEFDASR
jgi:hypothetical protein